MPAELATPLRPMKPARLAAIRAWAARTPGTPAARAVHDLLAEVDRLTPAAPHDCELKPGERRVLISVASGRTLDQTAEDLHLSIHTVKTHLFRLRKRIGAASSAHAVAIAFANEWITRSDLYPGRDER
ncbi:response regulator transcription factor [Streptomyces sp. NPDC087659]|uniref:helix-turn-helix transcriptional regulator n=1 Tax=Streptomyces sp. NPDC087659 TaxID=3365801 RepID=UPI003812B591